MTVDVAILGGGLAGLACATLLSKAGATVQLLEKSSYPTHRVCGEYLSSEVEPFLQRLGLDPSALGAKRLTDFELTTRGGRRFACTLPGGGLGVSRFRLDAALASVAESAGASVRTRTAALEVYPKRANFRIRTPTDCVEARLVIGCFGKRSTLDRTLGRPSFRRRSPYVAIKRHFRGPFPQNLVGLHSIPGGYCGISPVENDLVNVCYMTQARVLKAMGSVRGFDSRGLGSNPLLSRYLDKLHSAFEPAMVISQLDFAAKPLVSNHVLMLGDAAGSIHPLCGNGMAMGFRAANLLAPLALAFLDGKLSRHALEQRYQAAWKRAFTQRRLVGRLLQPLLESRAWSEGACATAARFPVFTTQLVRRTHGQPF